MLGGAERDGRAGTGVSGLTVSQEQRARRQVQMRLRRQTHPPRCRNASRWPSCSLPIGASTLCRRRCRPFKSLALSATSAGLVFSVFFAGRLIANLPAAWLVERAGPKWTAVAGSAALMLVRPSRRWPFRRQRCFRHVASRVGVALPAAGLLSVLRARPGGGAAMTAFNLSTGAGGSAGLLSGGYLTGEFGWRAVFWLSTVVSGVLLAGSLLARVRAAVSRTGRTAREEKSVTVRQSRSGEVAAVAANLLVFVNYSIWVVSPLLGAEKFGFDAGQVGLMLLFVNVVHLASAVPFGGIIRKAGGARSIGSWLRRRWCRNAAGAVRSERTWLLAPMALYAIGQVAGNSSAGDLILHLGGGGGRAVGAVRLSSDIGLVAGPAAVGVLADAAGVAAPLRCLA